jgi:predicted DNA-binding protein
MKTMAIRLDDELHAQLSVLAQLKESTITDEIRSAIEAHLHSCKASPELGGRAKAVLEEIERDSQARQAAIATLFGGNVGGEVLTSSALKPEVKADSAKTIRRS